MFAQVGPGGDLGTIPKDAAVGLYRAHSAVPHLPVNDLGAHGPKQVHPHKIWPTKSVGGQNDIIDQKEHTNSWAGGDSWVKAP